MKTHTLFRATLIPLALAVLLTAPAAPAQEAQPAAPAQPGNAPGAVQGGPPGPFQGGARGGFRGGRGGFFPGDAQDSSLDSSNTLRIVDGSLLLPPIRREPPQPATLENIVAFLRTRHPEVNFVLAPELSDVRIQNLLLRNASLDQELNALRVASGDLFRTDESTPGSGTGEPPLIQLVPSPMFSRSASEVAVEAFNLSHYSPTTYPEGKSREELVQEAVAALQDAIYQSLNSMNLNVDSLKFFYHPGSGVFVVSGNRDSVAVAKKVVLAFCSDSQSDKPAAAPAAVPATDPRDDQISQLKSHLASLEAEIARLNAEHAGATNR